MSRRTVADVADASGWIAVAPDATPSTEIAVEQAPAGRLGEPAIAIVAQDASAGHAVQRMLAQPVDLTRFDDLELELRADRAADGSQARPLYLALRLGSERVVPGAAGNDWQRLIAISAPGVWEQVSLALDDLADAVRGAVTQVRLACTQAGAAFTVQLRTIAATRHELLLDVDHALVQRVAGGLELDGSPVSAVVAPATPPDPPFFRIRNYAVRPAEERSPSSGRRSDYTAQGFSIRPPAVPVDVFYAIEPVARDRAQAAAMFQHAFAELAPRTTMDVSGRRLTVDWIEGPALEFADISDQPALHVRVATSKRPLARRSAVVPAENVDVKVDGRAIA